MNRSWRGRPGGATLIEFLVLLLVFFLAVVGGMRGLEIGAAHGTLGAALGLVLGFASGLLAGIAGLFVVVSVFELAAMVRRALQPGRTVCVCGRDAEGPVPDGEDSLLHPPDAFAEPKDHGARERRESGLLDEARVALAARLGHPPSADPGVVAVAPPIEDSTVETPGDLATALRSSLPPRLVLAWACGSSARALAVLEAEFHQDRLGREGWQAARRILDDPGTEAVASLEARPTFWPREYRGCRVVTRPFWDRVLRRRTRGEHAAEALERLRGVALAYARPEVLWATYEKHSMSDAYDTPESRLRRAQPGALAEGVAESAALAAAAPAEEYAWQRAYLARLVLGWESWDRDLAAWRQRVLEEWIPRVRRELSRARFDIPAYIDRIRAELVPWDPPARGPTGSP